MHRRATRALPRWPSAVDGLAIISRVLPFAYYCLWCTQQRREPSAPSPLPQHGSGRGVDTVPCASAGGGAAAAPSGGGGGVSELETRLGSFCASMTRLFPLWVLLAAGTALVWPELYTWFDTNCVTYGLMFVSGGSGVGWCWAPAQHQRTFGAGRLGWVVCRGQGLGERWEDDMIMIILAVVYW